MVLVTKSSSKQAEFHDPPRSFLNNTQLVGHLYNWASGYFETYL